MSASRVALQALELLTKVMNRIPPGRLLNGPCGLAATLSRFKNNII